MIRQRPGIEHRFEDEIGEDLQHDKQRQHLEWSGPPSSAARPTTIGAPEPSTSPTYRMNLSAALREAQSNVYGTPRKESRRRRRFPYTRLTSDYISSCQLTRVPASSIGFVVMANRPCPNSPISRSRRSRRSRSMKMTVTSTSPAVPKGPTIGPSHANPA